MDLLKKPQRELSIRQLINCIGDSLYKEIFIGNEEENDSSIVKQLSPGPQQKNLKITKNNGPTSSLECITPVIKNEARATIAKKKFEELNPINNNSCVKSLVGRTARVGQAVTKKTPSIKQSKRKTIKDSQPITPSKNIAQKINDGHFSNTLNRTPLSEVKKKIEANKEKTQQEPQAKALTIRKVKRVKTPKKLKNMYAYLEKTQEIPTPIKECSKIDNKTNGPDWRNHPLKTKLYSSSKILKIAPPEDWEKILKSKHIKDPIKKNIRDLINVLIDKKKTFKEFEVQYQMWNIEDSKSFLSHIPLIIDMWICTEKETSFCDFFSLWALFKDICLKDKIPKDVREDDTLVSVGTQFLDFFTNMHFEIAHMHSCENEYTENFRIFIHQVRPYVGEKIAFEKTWKVFLYGLSLIAFSIRIKNEDIADCSGELVGIESLALGMYFIHLEDYRLLFENYAEFMQFFLKDPEDSLTNIVGKYFYAVFFIECAFASSHTGVLDTLPIIQAYLDKALSDKRLLELIKGRYDFCNSDLNGEIIIDSILGLSNKCKEKHGILDSKRLKIEGEFISSHTNEIKRDLETIKIAFQITFCDKIFQDILEQGSMNYEVGLVQLSALFDVLVMNTKKINNATISDLSLFESRMLIILRVLFSLKAYGTIYALFTKFGDFIDNSQMKELRKYKKDLIQISMENKDARYPIHPKYWSMLLREVMTKIDN